MPSAPAHASTLDHLVSIAQEVHLGHGPYGAPEPDAHLIFVTEGDEAGCSVGTWPIPDLLGHRLLPLVGFLAPEWWWAAGVRVVGQAHTLGAPSPTEPAPSPRRVRSTVLSSRSGVVASVVGSDAQDLQVITEPPVGFAADVVARVLGLPTPPPEHTSAAFVELTWLDRVATGLSHRRSHGRSWRWLADRHPLRGPGPVPEPSDLAMASRRYAIEHPWEELRERMTTTELPAASWGPPGGATCTLGPWHDEGSLARFVLRQLPHPEPLLATVLTQLPAQAAAGLCEALVELDSYEAAAWWG